VALLFERAHSEHVLGTAERCLELVAGVEPIGASPLMGGDVSEGMVLGGVYGGLGSVIVD
jgi:hypothetical protein